MSRKLVFELVGEKGGLFCNQCKFLEDTNGIHFCKLFVRFLQPGSDGYEAYRCKECWDAEEK